jgi:hypothetical protein
MSGLGRLTDPDYIRLSGEIADDAILRVLRELYPRARIEHERSRSRTTRACH